MVLVVLFSELLFPAPVLELGVVLPVQGCSKDSLLLPTSMLAAICFSFSQASPGEQQQHLG